MALKIVRGKNLPIGADMGWSAIKLAQLRLAEGNYELVAADTEEIPRDCRSDPAARMNFLAEAFRRMLKPNTFRGRQCVLSLPADETCVQHVKLPRLKQEDLPKVLRSELRGKLPYDVEEAEIQYVMAGEVPAEGETKHEVIVVSARRRVLESYLAMSRRAKLDVVGINIEPCAVVECFGRLFRRNTDSERTILYVDMGARSTQVVFSHGNRIVFARNLQIGGDLLDQAIADGLGMPAEGAHSLRRDLIAAQSEQAAEAEQEVYTLLEEPLDLLSNELSKCLRYYEAVFRGRAIERAIFIGGQAYDRRLCQALARRLNVPAQIGDPLLRVKRIDETGQGKDFEQGAPQPDWAVAVGLSIGAAQAA